nr:MAG TPA: hypothetical protein [Caudoviricetes sp.]
MDGTCFKYHLRIVCRIKFYFGYSSLFQRGAEVAI